MGFLTQLQHGWNAFTNRDPTPITGYGSPSWFRPDYTPFSMGNERTIVTAIYNRIAVDVSKIELEHVKLDKEGRYSETMKSGLNNCLTLEANIDQTGRAFIQEMVESMFDEGTIAVVPTETDINPYLSGSYDIKSMRTGKIVQWMPRHVQVDLYNEENGRHERRVYSKDIVAIITNPFYSVMNENNSVLKRLIHKLNLLDTFDDQTASGKLNMIIQLPYVVKTNEKRSDLERRRKEIEMQLVESKYGIAYMDAAEHITQLNRPLDNNLMSQVESLTSMLYSQLGLTKEIMEGTADEKAMTNYYSRTIEPILTAISLEFTRKFLTKTARTQGHAVMYFNKPFDLVPTKDLAELADKFTRNEIMSGNEFRQVIGLKPSDDPKDDALLNKNIARDDMGYEDQNGMDAQLFDDINQQTEMNDNDLDDLESMLHNEISLMHYASPYYDPVKAHEYYLKTRQLKGRSTSTSGLNDQGHEAAEYIKNQIDQDQKRVTENITTSMKNQMASAQRQKALNLRNAARQTQAEIAALREQMKGLSKSQIEKAKPFFEKKIEALRDANDKHKADIQTEFDNDMYKLRTDTNNNLNSVKEEYRKRYEDELNKLKADESYAKKSSSGSGSKKSGSGSGSKKSSNKKTKKDYHIWYGDKK